VFLSCVSGTVYTGTGESGWSAPSNTMLSSCSGTGSVSLNQLRNISPYDQQLLVDAMRGPTKAHYVQSNHFSHGYAADEAQRDAGYSSAEMPPSTFIASMGSQLPDAAQNVDHSFDAVCLRSPAVHLRQGYAGSYSPMSASTPPAVVASSIQDVNHISAHKWASAAVPVSSGPRSYNPPSTSWQNMHQQADTELTATAGSGYCMATPQTTFLSPSQYSAVTSVGSPNTSSISGIPSPLNSPYSPSFGKTYSEVAGNDALQLPLHMQPHYLENLLQLHYLLLASNKLLAPRYPPPRYPPSLGAPRFDSCIHRSTTSAARSTMFNINSLSSSPASFQHGFTAARFPRSASNNPKE